MKTTEMRCDECRYWDTSDAETPSGWCRRGLPLTLTGDWPVTDIDDWCGEWTVLRPGVPRGHVVVVPKDSGSERIPSYAADGPIVGRNPEHVVGRHVDPAAAPESPTEGDLPNPAARRVMGDPSVRVGNPLSMREAQERMSKVDPEAVNRILGDPRESVTVESLGPVLRIEPGPPAENRCAVCGAGSGTPLYNDEAICAAPYQGWRCGQHRYRVSDNDSQGRRG